MDLGSELGAMDPGAEHGFKTHGQVPLAEAVSCIISENILRSRQALDSAFSMCGFDVRNTEVNVVFFW